MYRKDTQEKRGAERKVSGVKQIRRDQRNSNERGFLENRYGTTTSVHHEERPSWPEEREEKSPLVTPKTNNADRKCNTRQPSARLVEPALPVHLALNGFAVHVVLGLNHNKVFILACI